VDDVTRPVFSGPDWTRLTVAERIEKCHAFAREAALLAQAASPETREQYRDLAAKWNTLAAEMEEAARDARWTVRSTSA
jgi:hypothetical protein